MLISVIVPCRNESAFIGQFIEGVFRQELNGSDEIEVIVADGQSDDGTREQLDKLVTRYARLKVIENPDRFVPHALNRAIAEASGEIILCMGVHAIYDSDYVRNCIEVLEATGADNVGGVCEIASGNTLMSRAIAAALRSPFATGGGAMSGRGGRSGWVDTVPFGCWRREAFERFGLFDEALVRNQDDEHNFRIWKNGGRVWQDARIRFRYVPRAKIRDLFRQYLQYGYWKVYVIRKHGRPAAVRHVIPAALVLALLILAGVAPFAAPARVALMAVLGLYSAFLLGATSWITARERDVAIMILLPVVLAVFHIAYGWGFVLGVWDLILLRRSPRNRFTVLSRSAS